MKTILFIRAAIANMGMHQQQRGPVLFRARLGQRGGHVIGIVAVRHGAGMPPIGFEPPSDIFGKREAGPSRQRHVVLVVEIDEFAQAQMPRERGSLGSHAFHQIAIRDERISVMIHDGVIRSIVAGCEPGFGNGHAHAIAETLPERAGGNLHAGSVVAALGMPRRVAAPLAEALDFVQRQIIAGEMQQAVEKHRTMPGRQHETVPVRPLWIARVVLQVARP